jgi:D-psicose/D-tagatose/L-ribulose 3-epimerase
MELAASNISWDVADDDTVAGILRAHGFTGVEIAPSKRWQSPSRASRQEIASYRGEWEQRGLKIVAMQALLFGRPDLTLFGDPAIRQELATYLSALIEMAHGLGARALVFGSPKNRQRGQMPLEEAIDIAVGFFRELGSFAAARGCVICIEPNPTSYECDFINTTIEAVRLCQRIASDGVRVNGDVGSMVINQEDVGVALTSAFPWLGHFHASEPALAEVSDGAHQRAAGASLRQRAYTGWISVEMRAGGGTGAVARAADRVRRLYLEP